MEKATAKHLVGFIPERTPGGKQVKLFLCEGAGMEGRIIDKEARCE